MKLPPKVTKTLNICLRTDAYYTPESNPHIAVLDFDPSDMDGYALIRKQEVEFDLPTDFDPTNAAIGALRKQQSKIRAAAEVTAKELQNRIDILLAIEDHSND